MRGVRVAELGFPWVVYVGRQAAIGALAGLIAGALVGGLGGRLVMRISAIAAGERAQGMLTENGNVVGQVTLEGTVGLILFVGAFSGFIGGLLFMAVRRWLPGSGWRQGLAYGLLLLAALGTVVVDGANPDFKLLSPAWLNVGMFAVLFPLFGLVLALLVDRFDRVLPAAGKGPLGRSAYLFPVLALGYALLFLGILGVNPAVFALILAAWFVFGAVLAALAVSSERSPAAGAGRPLGVWGLVYPLLAGVYLLLLSLPVGAFFEAEDLQDRVLPGLFLMLLVAGVVPRTPGRAPAAALAAALMLLPALVGLAFDAQSARQIFGLG